VSTKPGEDQKLSFYKKKVKPPRKKPALKHPDNWGLCWVRYVFAMAGMLFL
jgi:hypothetical protein